MVMVAVAMVMVVDAQDQTGHLWECHSRPGEALQGSEGRAVALDMVGMVAAGLQD